MVKELTHFILFSANAFALFLKSQRKWSSADLTSDSISKFKDRLKRFSYDPCHVLPHGNYLVNLGNPDAYVLLANAENTADGLMGPSCLIMLFSFYFLDESQRNMYCDQHLRACGDPGRSEKSRMNVSLMN